MFERKLNGRELMNAGRWDEALSTLQQEITTAKSPFYSYVWRGIVYRHLNRIDDAIADFSAAIDSPIARGTPYAGYSDAFYYRGNAYLARSNFAQADADHQRYIDLNWETNAKGWAERRQRYHLRIDQVDPADYPRLGRSFSAPDDCKLALADCTFAIAHGHTPPTIDFCMGAAYEGQRDFFRAIECYRRIEATGSLAEAVKFAIEWSQQAALYVEMKDKQLLQPDIEYLTIHGDRDADSSTCYYFDLDGERQEEVKGYPKLAPDWKHVASRAIRELYYEYYQREKARVRCNPT